MNFGLVPNAYFDRVGILTHSFLCCVCKYNKDNQENSELVSLYWPTASTTLFVILMCTRGRSQETFTFITMKSNYQQQ